MKIFDTYKQEYIKNNYVELTKEFTLDTKRMSLSKLASNIKLEKRKKKK